MFPEALEKKSLYGILYYFYLVISNNTLLETKYLHEEIIIDLKNIKF